MHAETCTMSHWTWSASNGRKHPKSPPPNRNTSADGIGDRFFTHKQSHLYDTHRGCKLPLLGSESSKAKHTASDWSSVMKSFWSCFLDYLGPFLGLSWANLGSFWDPFWTHLGLIFKSTRSTLYSYPGGSLLSFLRPYKDFIRPYKNAL